MRMPTMDGYQATKAIRASSKGGRVKIIALTASTYEEEKAIVMAAGCNDYVQKPFKEDDIFTMMHNHLGIKYVYQEIKGKARKIDPEEALGSDKLKTLPNDLLNKLEKLAVRARAMEIEELIEEIRAYSEVIAQSLTELADSFEYAKIAQFARAAITG